jgi:hypothetical protein
MYNVSILFQYCTKPKAVVFRIMMRTWTFGKVHSLYIRLYDRSTTFQDVGPNFIGRQKRWPTYFLFCSLPLPTTIAPANDGAPNSIIIPCNNNDVDALLSIMARTVSHVSYFFSLAQSALPFSFFPTASKLVSQPIMLGRRRRGRKGRVG